MNKIIVINGPAAVGKTSIIKILLKKIPQLKSSVTYTTRGKRPGKEDKDMRYISRPDFEQMVRDEKLLEWEEHYNNLYGSARDENLEIMRKHLLLMNIGVRGSLIIKKKFPDSLLIYILPENFEQIEKRLTKRKLEPADLKKRIADARASLAMADKYDYQVINREGLMDATVIEIERIIRAYCDL